MPDSPEVPETAAAAEPEVAAPPVVESVSRADFERVIAENRQQVADMRQQFETALASARQPRAEAPPPAADLTDDQLQREVDEGRMTQIAATSAAIRRENRRFAAEHIDPMRAAGASSISSLSKTTAMSMTTDAGKLMYPHFRRFDKEIDTLARALPAGSVLTPEVYGQLYHYVVGQHADTLADERVEAAVRQKTSAKPESTAAATRTARSNAAPGSQQVPTVEDSLGTDAARALERRGLNPDEFAKKLGYKDWNAYHKEAVEPYQAGVA